MRPTGGPGQLTQVVALTATGINAAQSRVSGRGFQYLLRHRGSQRLIMSRVEETRARRDHCLTVTRIARALVLHSEQVDIAAPRDIETVPAGAAPARVAGVER